MEKELGINTREFMTKIAFYRFVESYGCTYEYDQDIKTMYVRGLRAQECISSIEGMGMTVPFTLKVD